MDGYQEKKESNTVYSQRKTYQKRNSSHRSQKIHSGDIIPQQSKDNHYKEGVYTRISTGRRSTGRQSGTPGQPGRRRSQSAYGENRRRRSGAENNLREWEILEQENERDYQEYLAQKRKRRERKRREEEIRQRKRKIAVRGAGGVLAGVIVILLIYGIFFSNPVLRTVTVEAGTQDFQTSNFLRKDGDAEFVTDMTQVDTSHVGEQEIQLNVNGKERTSTLSVQDTEAPKGEAETATVNVGGELSPDELVTNIEDNTDVTCSFKEEPDLSGVGTVPVTIVLTDEGGNTTEIESEAEVIEDTEEPVIDGVAPLEGFIGEPISYKSEITVTDNCDKEVELEVDTSDVDTETEGTYDVIYTATDRAGNTAQAETTITMKEKPQDYVEPEEVYAEADEVLAEITTDDMTLKEKARAIYDWCRNNIGYISTSDKDSWTNGAHQGFTQGQGDCFVFFSTAKALLTEAGIPNIDVVKSDTSHSSHYWSLIDCGDGWYHFDTTPRSGGGEFFMLTDEELLEYSESHDNSHIFDQSLYPATPTTDSTIE